MNLLCLDFETMYSNEYTLKKLTTEEYVRDERFEALVLAFAYAGESRPYSKKQGFISKSDIARFLATFDWRETAVLCHNAHFDGLILSHHYGVRPAFWFDTLPMARLLGGPTQRLSLEALAEAAGLPQKTVPYQDFKGRSFSALDPPLLQHLGAGAIRDCELTLLLFELMFPLVPDVRLHAIDQTVRMFTEPVLQGDSRELENIATLEHMRKGELLAELQVSATELCSNPQFQALLEAQGVEIEFKLNPKGERIPAFAKTDPFMQELQTHENERIRALADARIANRSSIRETRAARFAGLARRGNMPVYLGAFGAANTLRWAAGDATNWQNIPKEGGIGRAIHAPEGCTLIIADKAQVELRICLGVAGQYDQLEKFERGEDSYKDLASNIYHRSIQEITDAQRFVGKTAKLGCIFGMGADKFLSTCRAKAVIVSGGEAVNAVSEFRRTHPKICKLWRDADAVLPILAGGGNTVLGPCHVSNGKLHLPDGSYLSYTLEFDERQQSWKRMRRGGAWSYIWGGGLVENMIQALSALDISETIQRIYNRTKQRAVLLKHDEAVYCAPLAEAAAIAEIVEEEFRRPPAWLEYCPMGCDIAIRETLGK